MFRYSLIGPIVKLHGLKGALKVKLDNQLYKNELFQAKYLYIEKSQKLSIIKIFDKKETTFKVLFKEIDSIEKATSLIDSNLFLQKETDFLYEDLIGIEIGNNRKSNAKSNPKKIEIIENIYNFGAGIVLETKKRMISIDEIDLNTLTNKCVYFKKIKLLS